MTGNGACSRVSLIATLLLAQVTLCVTGVALWAAPSVRNVAPSGTQVGLYDKLELTFGVDTVATNLYWPYDPSPAANTVAHPNAVPVGVGVSVDGLFSKDNWQTTVVQPGFYFQDYERRSVSSGDWIYPLGAPSWRIRFSPTAVGEWRYRIRVTDVSGSTTYEPPTNSFACVASSSRGFVRVSSKDPRYFETDDGSYLNLVGLGDYTTDTYGMDSLYSSYTLNRVNLLRVWWQASQGPVLFGCSGQGGFVGWRGLAVATDVARQGELFSGKITGNGNASTSVDVKPETSYRFSAYVKTVGLVGEGDCGAYLQAFDCTQPNVPLTEKLKGDTEWRLLVATVTTNAGQYNIGWLNIIVSGTTAGAAYFADVSLREDLGSGQYGPELVWRPSFDAEKDVSQLEAWKADYQVELARSKGIYLKVCLQEKADVVFRGIHADGTAGSGDDNNVYAWSTHASRTYQKYFWRYVIARYGYATNIHSIEFCNEGDPFNGNHYGATQALADFVRQIDPNRHLVTTSFWHSFPTKEFWNNPSYPSVGYADWHQYIGLQDGNNLQYVYGWGSNAVVDKTVHRSAPQSLHVTGTGAEALVSGYQFAIIPGHTYTIKCYVRGQGLTATGSQAGSPSLIYPTVRVAFKDGWWTNEIAVFYPGKAGDLMGTYDWTLWSFTVTAPTIAKYMQLSPGCHWAVGDCWFDDITMHDDTAGTAVEVPNGNFDSERLDFDSALMTYSIGTQTGWTDNRVVRMPVVRGETGISGNNVYGDVYRGIQYVGENQQLADDTSGVWYRKFVWGQINPAGIVDIYWWTACIGKYGLTRYAKAYQSFMSGIPLSNGHYTDAAAVTSVSALRAWGQKDLTRNSAHLWIDNTPYTWKSVVDHVSVPYATGTVTISGFRNGAYRAEWWNTMTGVITRTDDVQCVGGNIVLSVQNLQSDTACKLYPTPAKISLRVLVPSSQVYPGQTVTVTVEYTNTDTITANNVSLTARVPAQMTYVAGSAEATGGSYDAVTGVVTWTVASIAANQTGTRTFQAKVN